MSVVPPEPPTVAVVVLTTGTRNLQVRTLAQSIEGEPFYERILIGNGRLAPDLPGWDVFATAENLGVPGGRVFGLSKSTAEVVVFLDDDASVVSTGLVSRMQRVFADHQNLGALGLRLVAPSGVPLRRWKPSTGPDLPGNIGLKAAASFPGGAHAVRRDAFHSVGGYHDEFFFKHEETDLAWALLDAGWEVAYDESIQVEHPETVESRHANIVQIGVRNKIWLVRLRLPAPLVPVALVLAVARNLSGCTSGHHLRELGRGIRAGLGTLPGTRNAMRWATVAELTRRRRPPVL